MKRYDLVRSSQTCVFNYLTNDRWIFQGCSSHHNQLQGILRFERHNLIDWLPMEFPDLKHLLTLMTVRLIPLLILTCVEFHAVAIMKIPLGQPKVTENVTLNGLNVLAAPSDLFTKSFEFLALLEVTSADDVGYCSGALIENRVIVTAAHCLESATKIKVYFFNYQNGLNRTVSVDAISWQTLPNWKAGIPPGEKVPKSKLKDINDFGLLKITKSPSWTSPILFAPQNTSPLGGGVFYILNLEHRWPEPLIDSVQISLLSIRNSERIERSANFYGFVPNVFPGKTSGVCKGDSGAPVTTIVDGKLALVGLTIGAGVGNGTNPAEEISKHWQCSDIAIFTNISMRLNDINTLHDRLD